jgi:hypothetical protein
MISLGANQKLQVQLCLGQGELLTDVEIIRFFAVRDAFVLAGQLKIPPQKVIARHFWLGRGTPTAEPACVPLAAGLETPTAREFSDYFDVRPPFCGVCHIDAGCWFGRSAMERIQRRASDLLILGECAPY